MNNSFGKIEEKLSKMCLPKNMGNNGAQSIISRIELKYKFQLPEDYKKFIISYGGSYFEIDDIYYKSVENINCFIGCICSYCDYLIYFSLISLLYFVL